MRLPLRLALRYLVKRRSSTMVHLISGISVLVIAAVTTAMVCILSAFNGIEDLVKTLFGTLDADLAVVPVTGQVLPESWGAHLDSLEGVAAWTAVLEDECVARDGETVRVASLLGVRADYPSVAPIDQAVVEGKYMVGGNTLGVSCACLGLGVRSELGISSDELEPPVFSLSAPIRGRRLSTYRERAFRTIPMHACGTFSINADLDTRYLMVPLKDAQSLLAREGAVSRFEVKAEVIPLLSAAIDEPTAYEAVVVQEAGEVTSFASGLAADHDAVGLGSASAAFVLPVTGADLHDEY